MMEPIEQDPLRLIVQQWTEKADLDFHAARQLLDQPNIIREAVAFHCQQTVEKYIKAFLVSRRVGFPKSTPSQYASPRFSTARTWITPPSTRLNRILHSPTRSRWVPAKRPSRDFTSPLPDLA